MEVLRRGRGYLGAALGSLMGALLGGVVGWFLGLVLVLDVGLYFFSRPDCDDIFSCFVVGIARDFASVVIWAVLAALLTACAGCWVGLGCGKHPGARATALTLAPVSLLIGSPLLLLILWFWLAAVEVAFTDTTFVAVLVGIVIVGCMLAVPAVCALTARWIVLKASGRSRTTSVPHALP